jgi:hypothetical protein
MSFKQFFGVAVSVGGFAALVVVGSAIGSAALRADDDHASSDTFEIEAGLQAAPVHLTYDHGDRKLVGLGSYLVNVASECNGCHSAGPATQWAPGHNPYQRLGPFSPPEAVNPATYLGGGRDFGQVGPVTSATVPPHIISRNLTPDSTGLPEQGADYGEFVDSMRYGIDHDHLHPNCGGAVTTNCFNPPFDGNKLQIMPWTAFQNLTDRDLRAIYEYLRAIPCIASPGHTCAATH